jgi:hypothetical protein
MREIWAIFVFLKQVCLRTALPRWLILRLQQKPLFNNVPPPIRMWSKSVFFSSCRIPFHAINTLATSIALLLKRPVVALDKGDCFFNFSNQ